MRSIIKKNNSNRTKQIILAVGLVIVMFISVLGYAFQGDTNSNSRKIIYNGFEFIDENGFWFVDIGQFQFTFEYNPNQIERIETDLNYLNSYSGEPLYIFSEDSRAEAEIGRNLNQIALRVRRAYFEGEEGEENLPTKTCGDNFIIIKKSNETSITQNQSCVFIQGPEEDLTKITDEFLFKILNIV